MKRQSSYRLNWAMATTCLVIIALVGCAGPAAPTLSPESSSTSNAASTQEPTTTLESAPTSEAASPSPEATEPTATTAPEGTNVKYQDDFTNPSTEWNEATLGDYHVGYHEPEWYEIEVKSPNSKVPVVPVPNREVHEDATIELEVSTFSTKTAAEGDFRYGLVFRRSGDLWYGFFISQPTKTWYVVKNTAAGQQVLAEGVEESIHERDVNDILRVDAQGSSFVFHINDTLVRTVTDADYASGEVGFYVESIDNPQTHIHFDRLTIADLNLSFTCTIKEGGTVNVRMGPGTQFPSFGVLDSGDTVKALGKSSSLWVQVVVDGSEEPGWVSYSDGYMTCTPGIDLFPVINP